MVHAPLPQMKILLVAGSYPPMHCGVGDYAGRLASALAEDEEIGVSVLTTEFEAGARPRARVNVLRVMSTWHARGRHLFVAAMRRVEPDIVHIQFPTQGYDRWSGLAAIALIARFRWRVPVVATLHEFLPRTTYRADRWIHALALLANRIVVVRPEYYATIPRLLRVFVPERRIRFISNASAIPVATLGEAERTAIKDSIGCGTAKLVAFFGFSFPHKGVDLLFRIADPARHHLLLIGELKPNDTYHAKLRALAESSEWKGRVTITGFVDSGQAARLLAAADAAVFPYRVGGGIWNSSLHAATSQGTFTLTTSMERNGYDSEANAYYARAEDVDEMRQALLKYQGTRKEPGSHDAWLQIARAHKELYLSLIAEKVRR